MADLSDVDHYYGGDIGTSPSGDIALVTKRQRTIQRIIRRVMTQKANSQGAPYPWETDYGLGLGARIGEALDARGIAADFRSQMLLEATVAKTPAPVITVTEIPTGATIDVSYTDISGVPQNFSFNLTP